MIKITQKSGLPLVHHLKRNCLFKLQDISYKQNGSFFKDAANQSLNRMRKCEIVLDPLTEKQNFYLSTQFFFCLIPMNVNEIKETAK